jgi:hypothetical protein
MDTERKRKRKKSMSDTKTGQIVMGFHYATICDLFIYPGLREIGINFTPIKRITAGFIAGSASMVWVAVVQHYIYKVRFTTLSYVESLSDFRMGLLYQSNGYDQSAKKQRR